MGSCEVSVKKWPEHLRGGIKHGGGISWNTDSKFDFNSGKRFKWNVDTSYKVNGGVIFCLDSNKKQKKTKTNSCAPIRYVEACINPLAKTLDHIRPERSERVTVSLRSVQSTLTGDCSRPPLHITKHLELTCQCELVSRATKWCAIINSTLTFNPLCTFLPGTVWRASSSAQAFTLSGRLYIFWNFKPFGGLAAERGNDKIETLTSQLSAYERWWFGNKQYLKSAYFMEIRSSVSVFPNSFYQCFLTIREMTTAHILMLSVSEMYGKIFSAVN